MSSTDDLTIGPPSDDDEVRAFTRIVSRALFFPGADLDEWVEREGKENIRVARRRGRVAGGLIVQRLGQWFNGRSVPMAGIRTVGVLPEQRGRGIASSLMCNVLKEIHRNGVPISVLFPATRPVYRRAGYEAAGTRLTYRLPTGGIGLADRTLDLRPIEENDHDSVKEAYTERARRTSGNLDRSAWCWRRIFDPPPCKPRAHGYLVERDNRVEGYTVFAQKTGETTPPSHQLELADLVVLTPDAGRRLLTFFADHRSMASTITWCGAPADPLLYLPAEQEAKIIDRIDWMLRIVDVRGALEARGYPPAVSTEIHLEILDDVLPHNNGRLILEVAESRGSVRKGGQGRVCFDVRGLAAMYAGFLSPGELQAAGLVDGAEPDLARAGLLFAGPAPWMPDIF